ncbi:MAG: SWIM zinc finger family protein [Candidatus Andersenbacteria bacterium]|nr:SWIM zinc finger family protein [Candidatus Andersenbacteria bacterium]
MRKVIPKPHFTIHDIKYADDMAMFDRAQELYKTGKVGKIHEVGLGRGYAATVSGSKPYKVYVSSRHIDEDDCTCYMGQNEMLCKHMLALAIAVLHKTGSIETEVPNTDLMVVKEEVSAGMGKLRAYDGPSHTWFSYQRKLATGAGMIAEAIQSLPATEKNANYLWKLVLRISKKLATGGIDDSDGVVGNCVYGIIEQLAKYAQGEPRLKAVIMQYCKDDTGFGFEDELRNLLQKNEK